MRPVQRLVLVEGVGLVKANGWGHIGRKVGREDGDGDLSDDGGLGRGLRTRIARDELDFSRPF